MLTVGMVYRRTTSWMESLEHSGVEGKRERVRPCEGSQTTIVVVWQV